MRIGFFFLLIVVMFKLNIIEKNIIGSKLFFVSELKILVGIIFIIVFINLWLDVVFVVFIYLLILVVESLLIFMLFFGWVKLVISKFIIIVNVVIILK